MADIVQTVHAVLFRIIQQQTSQVAKIQASDRLTVELGLKSLDLAKLITILELELGVDPFARMVAITDMRTVGDLCEAYRRALSPETATAPPPFEPGGGRCAATPTGPDPETGGRREE